MTITQTASRIHPLVAGAAISVTVLALVGTAAIAGWLPTSHSATSPEMAAAPAPAAVALQAAPAPSAPAAGNAVAHQSRPVRHAPQTVLVRHEYAQAPAPAAAPAPAPAPQPAAQTNYLGIGTGAVIGGLIGNQVGGGRGRTLATIAGAVGGGMLGNAVQKQAQQSN